MFPCNAGVDMFPRRAAIYTIVPVLKLFKIMNIKEVNNQRIEYENKTIT